jgi:hypothetical protein
MVKCPDSITKIKITNGAEVVHTTLLVLAQEKVFDIF